MTNEEKEEALLLIEKNQEIKRHYFKLKSIPYDSKPMNPCYACEAKEVIGGRYGCKIFPF